MEKTTEELIAEIENLTNENEKLKAEKTSAENALNSKVEELIAERDKLKAERDEANDNLMSMRSSEDKKDIDEFSDIFGGMI